ncbi:uncharacterized protein LOC124930058 [Impatiens glandulifera]|uniref:uncharacterized protein LOC124930058 n=1 Tax=Impatiens glandulifera TaxID=253017 RepID=UPI001FB1820C|nr:uncharacterized protein LOC124930058 [Impatiens glandulifera]
MIDNAPRNNQIKSPTIQKEITRAYVNEVTNIILNDIGDNVFSLMVDECRDNSVKEQMKVVLRYVNKSVLENVYDDGTNDDSSDMEGSLIDKMDNYEFVFVMHFMKYLLEITNELSLDLQQNDQNMVLAVLDMMIQELNNRFSESTTEVFTCITCLDPNDSFSQFDIGKILYVAELYLENFSLTGRIVLENQLQTYIQNVRNEFPMIQDLGILAKKMIETEKHRVFTLVYRLIELALVLPVMTTSVKKVFSAMKIIKTDLCNRMSDEWMNDSLVVYIEKKISVTIENDKFYNIFNK